MHKIPDPLGQCRFYFDNPPIHYVTVDRPWWWPVLSLGVDIINVPMFVEAEGPVAIVTRDQKPWDTRKDVETIEALLRADGRPTFDAYSCPKAPGGTVVGLVNVIRTIAEGEDPPHETVWYSGPRGLVVDRQCLLPVGKVGTVPTHDIGTLSPGTLSSLRYALTGMANGHFQPGAERRR